jgi:WD40 repeat protein
MKPRDLDGDEQLARRLSDYEEALFAGQVPADEIASIADLGREDAERLRRSQRCLRLLEEIWPSHEQHLLSTPDEPAGRIDRFEIVRELGRGGFGIVYLANDLQLGRAVALKVQRPEAILSADLRRRFLREAKTAAVLAHPHIVSVYDAKISGVQCWIASEYCRGPTLKRWLNARTKGVDARAAANVVLALADAMAYAHARGVLHRDIKPSNVFLQPRDDLPPAEETAAAATIATDGEPESQPLRRAELTAFTPKLGDFGLARFDDEATDETRSGAQLGTPAYMAPEQVEGDRTRMDGRTDVYGLGVLLYEMLTGRLPYDGETRASTLSQVLVGDPSPPRQFRRDLPRDLEAITLRCLEKRPDRRYPSAAALEEDLQRFLNGEPTSARPVRAAERLWKWTRRHPALALLLGLVLVISPLVTGLIAGKNAELSAALETAWRNEQDANRQRALAEAGARELAQTLYAFRMGRAWQAYNSDDLATMDEMLRPYRPKGTVAAPGGFEYQYLSELRDSGRMTLRGHHGPVYSVTYSPDGKLLASASADHTVKLWDPVSGAWLATLTGHRSEVNCVAFSPEGEMVASASDDGEVRLWSVAERSPRAVLKGHKDQVVAVRFAPNGAFLASADNSGVLIIWDVKTSLPKSRLTRHRGRIEDLDISADSRLILTGGIEQPPAGGPVVSAARIWDVELGRETWSQTFGMPWGAHCVSFDRQGGGFVAGDSHGNLFRWNRDREQSDLVNYSSEQLKSIAISPDGSAIVVAGESRQIIVDRGGPGARRTILHGHRGTVWGLSISPDSKRLASASHDGTIKIWDLGADCRYRAIDWGPATDLATRDRSAQRFVTLERATGKYLVATSDCQQLADVTAEWSSPTPLTTAALATDHPLLALGVRDGSLRLYDYQQHQLLATLATPGGSPVNIGFAAADHMLLAVAGGKLRVWDLSDRTHPTLGAEWTSTDVAVSDNGESIAVTPPGDSRPTEFWRRGPKGWRKLWDCPSPAPGSGPPAFTADGRLVAVGDGENTVRIRDIASGHDLNVLKVTSLRNARLALSPDGRTLAIQALGRLTIWSLPAAMAVVDFDLRMKPDQMGFLPTGSALVVSGYSHSQPQPGAGEPPDRYQVVNLTASRVGTSHLAASGESAQSR